MNLSLALEIASLTDTGKVRSHNEDNLATDNEAGFVILADGMGGYSAGEVASGIAVTMLAEGLKTALQAELTGQGPCLLVKNEIEKTNGAIYQTATRPLLIALHRKRRHLIQIRFQLDDLAGETSQPM